MKRVPLFISFEGPEGSGKSTHIKLLFNYLKRKGFLVVKFREPGDTSIGEKIRKILLDPKNKNMGKLTETLLYMASRSQLIEEKISPYLKKGYIVLCDRFFDSTFAYQGFGLGVDIDLIKRLTKAVCKGIIPNLTIILDLPVKTGLRRLGSYKDRIEQREFSFHERLRRGYLKLAKLYPERIKVIKVDKNFKNTQRKIRELVLKRLCPLKI
ncbi:MAG: dTMP kinase [Candidatus Omnitrophica bacterium]|nr:dTMP kinase [Candidatus Omnitrophota bacterium]